MDEQKKPKRHTIYMPWGVWDEVRTLAFNERKAQQALLKEAVNFLLADRGCKSWDELKGDNDD